MLHARIAILVGLLLCAVLVLVLVLVPGSAAQAMAPGKNLSGYTAQQLLVQFTPGIGAPEQAALLADAGMRTERLLLAQGRRRDGQGDLQLARAEAGIDVDASLRHLQGQAGVAFVERNVIYRTDAVEPPVDGLLLDEHYAAGDAWNVYGADTSQYQNVYGTGAATAWALGNTCSRQVYVGIVDWGVMSQHPDLKRNMWVNPYDPVDGIDNDGNGFVDDWRGWDFVHGDNNTYDGVEDGHGTHVAGIIGASGGNGIGVIGMCPNVHMINAKFIGADDLGTAADAIQAIDYITDLKLRHGLNIVAINNSWGGFRFSQAMQDAITRAGAADILFVAVAGNTYSDNDVEPYYPSGYPNENIIAVAAIDKRGNKGEFSNWGLTTVDLGAPGVGVWSTVPLEPDQGSFGYEPHTGTSMATPHVTGAVALLAARLRWANAAQLKAILLSNTIPTPSLEGKTVTGGRLDVSGF
jgi:subtilisin family serine protease